MLVFGENILDLWSEHERDFIIFDIILDICLSYNTKIQSGVLDGNFLYIRNPCISRRMNSEYKFKNISFVWYRSILLSKNKNGPVKS